MPNSPHLILIHNKDWPSSIEASDTPPPPDETQQGKYGHLTKVAFGSALILIVLLVLIGIVGGWGWLSLVMGIMLAMACIGYLIVETMDWVRSITDHS